VLSKLVFRALCFAALLLAGVACKYLLPVYGVPFYGSVPPREHPTVKLTDFGYTPASPIHIGDKLTLIAQTNTPVADAQVFAELPAAIPAPTQLLDDGQPPDQAAGDGIWTAEKTWTADMGPVNDGYVSVVLGFFGNYASQTLTESLTVLPEEER
jgi:hypothetical protein